jgi:hypothetical protein
MRRALVLLTLLVIGGVPALAQERPPISTDRPGVGTSAEPVPRGALQIETGLDYARERKAGEPTEHRGAIALSVRYGLLDSLELRLDGEPVVTLQNGDDVTDVGDFQLGVKWRLLDGVGSTLIPTLSLFPSVKLPTAPDPIGNERVDATVIGLASWQTGPISVDLNVGMSAVAQHRPSGYLLAAILVAGVGAEVTEHVTVGGSISYASRTERDGHDGVAATVGISCRLTRDLAIDGAVITTIAGRGPDVRLQTGLSMRFWP